MSTMGRLLRWGIIGTGVIAKRFSKDLREHTGDINEVVSVLTRNLETATSFLQQNDLSFNRAFVDFDIFAASGIDVCYIATPHTSHVELTQRCLEKGLHVLVEKPFALETSGMMHVFDVRRIRVDGIGVICVRVVGEAKGFVSDGGTLDKIPSSDASC